MYALLTSNPASPELFMPTGVTVQVPTEVIDQADPSFELEFALRWARKAGLVTQAQFLEAQNSLAVGQMELGGSWTA